jgi:hypothetical protein
MATAAAAMMAKARREVEKLFFDNEAFSPDRAVEFDPRMPIQQRYLERLIGEGVVHEVEPGRYWLDRPAYEELRRQQFAWGMRILAIGLFVIIIAVAIQAVRHQL